MSFLTAFQPVANVPVVDTKTGRFTSGAMRFFLNLLSKIDVGAELFESRTTTSDATPKTIRTFGAPRETTTLIEAVVTARRTGGAAGAQEDGAAYRVAAAFKNVGGTATQIGATAAPFAMEDQAGWGVAFVPSGANVMLQAAGAADNEIAWHMTATVYKVGS